MNELKELTDVLDFSQYLENSTYSQIAEEVQGMVLSTTMLKLAPLLTAIAMCLAVYKYYVENKMAGANMPDMIRIFVLLIFTWSSVSLMSGIDKMSNGVIASFSFNRDLDLGNFYKLSTVSKVQNEYNLSDKEASELSKRMTGVWKQDKNTIKIYIDELKKSDEGGLGIVSMLSGDAGNSIMADLKFHISNMFKNAIIGNSLYILLLVKIVLGMLIFAFSTILRVIAPLAFAFDLVFKGTAIKWFKAYLTAKTTFLTFMIVEAFFLVMFVEMTSSMSSGVTSFSASYGYLLVGMMLTSVVCYCLTFWFTAKYVGAEGTGQFLSAASGIAMGGLNKAVAAVGKSMKR